MNRISRYQYIRFKKPFRRFIEEDIVLEKEPKLDSSEITHGSYRGLLFDKRWKVKRQIILERDINQCVICQSNLSLQVHHRQYHFNKSINTFKSPWDYSDDLLITLCEKCHKKGHKQHKVPTIYI